MKIKYLYLIFPVIFYFCSCDILRTAPFEVVSWSPGEGYHGEPEEIIVSLNFSHDPDRSCVEKRFSMTADEIRVRGNFLWDGRTMTFVPFAPFERNKNYNLSLSAEARNTEGLSMDFAFDRRFSTKPDNTRPELVFCFPENYAQIADPMAQVRLEFSSSVSHNSLYDNVSFSPPRNGSWKEENSGKTAVFSPAEPWLANNRYEIRVSSSLTGVNGMSAGREYVSIFSTCADHEEPYLVNARRVTANGAYFPLAPDDRSLVFPAENAGWEKNDRLCLTFSEPVDRVSVKNHLSAEGASSLVMDFIQESAASALLNEYFFHFENIPLFESRFIIRLKPGVKDGFGNESKEEYVYRIFADGEYSKLPALAGIRMPMAPGSKEDPELHSYGINSLFADFPLRDDINYPSGEKINTWIEFYFDTAPDASVDPFSLMELFRIDTTNNVIDFSPRRIKKENFTVPEPEKGWEKYQRMEISGVLTNTTNYGIVSFQITAGLSDSYGNKNENSFRIPVIK